MADQSKNSDAGYIGPDGQGSATSARAAMHQFGTSTGFTARIEPKPHALRDPETGQFTSRIKQATRVDWKEMWKTAADHSDQWRSIGANESKRADRLAQKLRFQVWINQVLVFYFVLLCLVYAHGLGWL